ncbi:hypothetical protein DTO271G3_6653 [Paecilomyces variotii]|nr:hypothetical protein DTO271G3_6653 [Paecilomyces variotii]
MSPSLFDTLAIELIDLVVAHLDCSDIAALRLTCHRVKTIVSQGRFTTFFKQRNVPLETRALQDLAVGTSQGHLICRLQDCTLTGVLDETENTEAAAEEDHRRLLTEAFCNIKQRSPAGCLATVRLRLVVRLADGTLVAPEDCRHSGRWMRIWDTAQRTFRVVMAALKATQLAVDCELDLFHGHTYCCLTSDIFVASVTTFPWTAIFGSLKKLKLNISSPHRASTTTASSATDDLHDEWTTSGSDEAAGRETEAPGKLLKETERRACTQVLFQGVLQLRSLLSELETVDLLWCLMGRRRMAEPTLLQPPASDETEPGTDGPLRLKECWLRGLVVAEADLLRFLQRTQPVALTLIHITLNPGTYDSIFGFLTDPETLISSYHLDDLFEKNWVKTVHFEIPGSPKFAYRRGGGTPSTLSRQGEDIKIPIRYHLPIHIAKGSGKHMRWRQESRRVYGPP